MQLAPQAAVASVASGTLRSAVRNFFTIKKETVYKNDTVSNGFIWFHTKMKPWRMEVKPYLSVRKTGC